MSSTGSNRRRAGSASQQGYELDLQRARGRFRMRVMDRYIDKWSEWITAQVIASRSVPHWHDSWQEPSPYRAKVMAECVRAMTLMMEDVCGLGEYGANRFDQLMLAVRQIPRGESAAVMAWPQFLAVRRALQDAEAALLSSDPSERRLARANVTAQLDIIGRDG